MNRQKLALVADLYGCPNRCLHCWLGHMPNRTVEDGADAWMVDYFRPYFDEITFYSWVREPDFCDGYRARWERDNALSTGERPRRFELASFWRIVRDPEYVKFLKEVGTRRVQLTFFGTESTTDRYIGRRGAYRELLKATGILIENGIAPRWQAFINEENKEELVEVLRLSQEMKLEERCRAFGEEFTFFVHEGSCDGENRKLYDIRICKEHIPQALIPYCPDYDVSRPERALCAQLRDDGSHVVYHNEERIVLNISNTFDVFFNFTHMTPAWRIGNLRTDDPAELVRRITREDTPALNLAREVTVGELVRAYGDPQSGRIFSEDDYKSYLLNRYLEEKLG